jgi:hypothetical protein
MAVPSNNRRNAICAARKRFALLDANDADTVPNSLFVFMIFPAQCGLALLVRQFCRQIATLAAVIYGFRYTTETTKTAVIVPTSDFKKPGNLP